GCMELWVSGTGLARAHGDGRRAEAIVAAAEAGEAAASVSLDRYIDRLGRGLAVICNVLGPDVIVLGGGMSNVSELYDRLPDIVARHAFADHWDGRIVAARWGDSSGVRGAARLWND
ncbi:ROK family protein, partial [Brevundimonas sp.]|uniref:ROK family protein n=1 Tax=Brevundimonas sp. TaxID=1871086 RepID=UPI0028ABD0DB